MTELEASETELVLLVPSVATDEFGSVLWDCACAADIAACRSFNLSFILSFIPGVSVIRGG